MSTAFTVSHLPLVIITYKIKARATRCCKTAEFAHILLTTSICFYCLFISTWSTQQQELHQGTNQQELIQISEYYFDGQGKALRPMVTMLMGKAINYHMHRENRFVDPRAMIATLISRMFDLEACSLATHKTLLILHSLSAQVFNRFSRMMIFATFAVDRSISKLAMAESDGKCFLLLFNRWMSLWSAPTHAPTMNSHVFFAMSAELIVSCCIIWCDVANYGNKS